jgi:hypothetical protein
MPPGPPPAPPPRLLVVISVDQLSGELFDAYRPHFTGGLARLARGTMFRNGYQAHSATETCPGHSTILTGALPSRSGIVANNWIDQSVGRSDKTVYCSEDERIAGSSSSSYTVSPFHLLSPTLGDRLKARAPQSRNVAVAGKDRSAVMMGGRAVDQRWYWDGKTFATDRKGAVSPTVTAFNAALAQRLAVASPPLDLPPLCQGKARPYTLAEGFTVGAGRLERAASDVRAFRASPDFDAAVLALGAGLVQEMRLGRGPATTDILSLGLAATDVVGHSFGNGGAEMCLQMLGLDRELGSFLDLLDSTGVDYAVTLTADHGAMDIPERLRDRGIAQATRADPALAPEQIGKRLATDLKLSGPVLLGEGIGGDVWLDRALQGRDRTRALTAAVAAYRAHPQVAAVFTGAELARLSIPTGDVARWDLRQRARATYFPGRSGDFMVFLKEYVSPIAKPGRGYAAGHGTPWDYDRRLPIVFWRKGMAASERTDSASTTDIAPTLSAMIGLPADASPSDGRCLDRIAGILCPTR